MKIYNKKIMMMSVFLLFVSGVSHARVRAVNARRDFERNIAKESMVVVLFYDERDKDLTRMYEDISKTQKYDDADVVFLKVNAARPELSQLASLYGVIEMPAFIFFHKGKRIADKKGVVQLTGLVSRDKLQSFIDEYFGKEIEKYIAQKNTRNKERFAQENESWKLYFWPRDMIIPSYGPEETTPKLE